MTTSKMNMCLLRWRIVSSDPQKMPKIRNELSIASLLAGVVVRDVVVDAFCFVLHCNFSYSYLFSCFCDDGYYLFCCCCLFSLLGLPLLLMCVFK